MATVELCYPVELPPEMWQEPGKLTEAGELALNAIGAALDRALRHGNARAELKAAGAVYRGDSWVTRWPGW